MVKTRAQEIRENLDVDAGKILLDCGRFIRRQV
jgi:hypothetical protein